MILSEQQYDEIVYHEQRNVEHWYTTAIYDEFQSRRLKLDQNSLFRYEFASSLYLFSPGDDDGHYCICDCRAEGGVVKRIPAGVLIRMEAVAESSFRVFFRFRGLQIAFSLIVLQVGCCYLI